MSYIQSTLIPGEEIIITPDVHNIVHARPIITFAIIGLLALLIGIIDQSSDTWIAIAAIIFVDAMLCGIWLGFGYLYYRRIEMAVTNKRVVCKTGIISVHSEELQWNRIESIEIRQGIFGRLLGYGDVYFSGTGVSYVRFGTIRDPWQTKARAAEILTTK